MSSESNNQEKSKVEALEIRLEILEKCIRDLVPIIRHSLDNNRRLDGLVRCLQEDISNINSSHKRKIRRDEKSNSPSPYYEIIVPSSQ